MTPQDHEPSQLGLPLDTPEARPTPPDAAPGLPVPGLDSPDALNELLSRWQANGWLRALDVQFARLLQELGGDTDAVSPLTLFLAALTSHQVGRGHVCIDLTKLLQDADTTLALPPEESGRRVAEPQSSAPPSTVLSALTLVTCLNDLRRSPVVRAPESDGVTPLMLEGSRLYLRRFWAYEQRIATAIQERLERSATDALADPTGQTARTLARALSVVFSGENRPDIDDQKLACALAARSRFAIITGGPGTGKTTTVVRLLAVLQAVAGEHSDRKLRVRLAAPTGKASARLNESIGGAVHSLPLELLPGQVGLDDIPAQVTTLHRLLGSRPGSRRFRHNRDNPLRLDVLVIDEASMVDVDLMASVFDALPDNARLILLGDKDQLASVDAGAVLGDLCTRADRGHYRPDTKQWLESVTGESVPADRVYSAGRPLDQAIAMLRTSYRFTGDSGIGRLARAVNGGSVPPNLLHECRSGALDDVIWLNPAGSDRSRDAGIQQISEHALTGSPTVFRSQGAGRAIDGDTLAPPVGYQTYLRCMRQHSLSADSPRAHWDTLAAEVLATFGDFQVLCALRRGPWGVEGLNDRIAHRLQDAGLIARTEGWYAGRPVLVTANDYNLGLMNGDVGITFQVPWGDIAEGEPQPVLRVAFPGNDGPGSIRWVAPSRLQHIETVYAMTVHKSQGSEFTHTCLVLPDRPNPVLTRELIYTGITRARHWFSLITGHPDILGQAVKSQVTRASGLAKRIYSATETTE